MTNNLTSLFSGSLKKKPGVGEIFALSQNPTPTVGPFKKEIAARREARRVAKLNEEAAKRRKSGTTKTAKPSPEKDVVAKRRNGGTGVKRKRLTTSLFEKKKKLGA